MAEPVPDAALREPLIGAMLRDAIARLRSAGSELPRLDAEVLLGSVAGLDRAAIVAHPEWALDATAAAAFEAAVARRAQGEPVAYIRGLKEFRGLIFRVDARALIPRPETERLVELGVAAVVERIGGAAAGTRIRILDVGTGCGAVVVSMAAELRDRGLLERTSLVATDLSSQALSLAAANCSGHGLAWTIRLVAADLVAPGEPPFDVILANLPYIPSAEVPRLPIAASFEPREALDGGPDGLVVVRRLIARLGDHVLPGGIAMLEIGADQGPAVIQAVAERIPEATVRIEADLSGSPRIAVVQMPPGHPLKHPERDRSGMDPAADPIEPAR